MEDGGSIQEKGSETVGSVRVFVPDALDQCHRAHDQPIRKGEQKRDN